MWRRPDGRALVATADFFTPIVDDARTWGRIAAANAASDVYAMGGTPLFALNLVAWPRDQLSLDLLAEVLEGGADVAASGGWVVAGGHTVDGAEPMYGQAVIGEVDETDLLTNAGARPGDTLVLTKPLGTGIVTTAVKRLEADAVGPGGRLERSYAAAVGEMTRLNAEAAAAAHRAGARAATDVTGFGLLGHLLGMLRASGASGRIDVDAVPLLPDIRSLIRGGFVPGGTERNLEHVRPALAGDVDGETLTLLADAQTSGGLLIACPADATADLVTELTDTGHTAARIGEVSDGPTGAVELV